MFQASIVLPSCNRLPELRQVIISALNQTVPVEIIVADDGSTDGTPEMLRAEFPAVRLLELGRGQGPCFQRNRGIEHASCEIVFPIDDDAILSSPTIVEDTLKSFNHPRVAAVGIPFINVNLSNYVEQLAPKSDDICVTAAFVGCAHAIRRDLFLGMKGYREHLFYMGEEDDLCLRLLNAGYVVRWGSSAPIHHLQSKSRVMARSNYYGRQNGVLFAWHNVPMPTFCYYLPLHIVNALLYSFKTEDTVNKINGIWGGLKSLWKYRKDRRPVTKQTFDVFRELRKKGPCPLSKIEARLLELK